MARHSFFLRIINSFQDYRVARRKRSIALSKASMSVLLVSAGFVALARPEPVEAQNVVALDPDGQVALTLETAVRDAVAWHPSVDQAVAALSASDQDIREAKAGYYPQINGGIGPSLSVIGRTSWRPRGTLSGSQMLYDFGKVGSAVDIARAGERVSRAQLLLAVDGLARNTAIAVIEIQRYHALLAVAHEQLDNLNTITELVQLRVGRGATTRSDGTQAEARIESARATILQIAAELQRWQSNLRHLTGREGALDVAAEAPRWLDRACLVQAPDWDRLPTVMQSLAQRDEAQASYRGARAARFPTISLGTDVDTDLRDPFSQSNDVSVGITVSSSLYQGGARKAREQASFYALQSADAALATARLEARRALDENREQIDNLEERLETIGRRHADMQETGRLYRLQYFELGTRTLLDLLNAQQELHQTRFDEVNAQHDMRRINLECLYYSGQFRDAFALTGTVVRGVTL